MKNTEEFIKDLITINFIEEVKAFGHYPFSLFVENENGENEIVSLALGGDVKGCYDKLAEYRNNNAKKMFLSIDFPRGEDIDHDFIAVFTVIGEDVSVQALPYSTNTGERFEIITESSLLNNILAQFVEIINE